MTKSSIAQSDVGARKVEWCFSVLCAEGCHAHAACSLVCQVVHVSFMRCVKAACFARKRAVSAQPSAERKTFTTLFQRRACAMETTTVWTLERSERGSS